MTTEYRELYPNGLGTPQPVEVLPPPDITQALAGALAGETAKPVKPVVPLQGQGVPHTWADVAYRAQDGLGRLGRISWKLCKLGICVSLDLADMVMVGWIGVNPIFEVGAALMTMALWGKNGLWGFAELADFTELLDPFIPTCTIIALASWSNDN